jgi:hypothetical protein
MIIIETNDPLYPYKVWIKRGEDATLENKGMGAKKYEQSGIRWEWDKSEVDSYGRPSTNLNVTGWWFLFKTEEMALKAVSILGKI